MYTYVYIFINIRTHILFLVLSLMYFSSIPLSVFKRPLMLFLEFLPFPFFFLFELAFSVLGPCALFGVYLCDWCH